MLHLVFSLLAAAPDAGVPARPPPPTCLFSNGRSVCGYDCTTAPDGAACARTPAGVCELIERRVHCWDPPAEVVAHPPRTQRPRCVSRAGEVACGYQCVSSVAGVACTQTPWGRCIERFGAARCWDPTPQVIHHGGPGLETAECVAEQGALACGWACKVGRREAACAQTPSGVCVVDDGKVQCVDPPLPATTHAG